MRSRGAQRCSRRLSTRGQEVAPAPSVKKRSTARLPGPGGSNVPELHCGGLRKRLFFLHYWSRATVCTIRENPASYPAQRIAPRPSVIEGVPWQTPTFPTSPTSPNSRPTQKVRQFLRSIPRMSSACGKYEHTHRQVGADGGKWLRRPEGNALAQKQNFQMFRADHGMIGTADYLQAPGSMAARRRTGRSCLPNRGDKFHSGI